MTLAGPAISSGGNVRGGLSHQPIVDRQGRVRGHELLFRGRDGEDFEGSRATATVLVTAACDIGWDRLGGDGDLFINVDQPGMLDRVLDAAPPERTVVEIVETMPVDDHLVRRLARLRAHGLRLALDDFVAGSDAEQLLGVVDVVKIDVLATPPSDEVGELVRRLQGLGIVVLAEKVEDEQMHERCLELGFELFQGYWYARPTAPQPLSLSPTRVLCLRLLGLLTSDEPDLGDIERLISSDPSLIVRVLRMANSAAVGATHKISSVRQAVVLVGPQALTGWMALMMLAADDGSSVDLTDILVQARTCEIVAGQGRFDAPGEAFLCGLVEGLARRSLADAGTLLAECGGSEAMRAAVSDGRGPLGELVRSVGSYLDGGAADLQTELAHLAALAWTHELKGR